MIGVGAVSDVLAILKSEQTARIVLRDTTLYVHIASIVAVYAAEGQAGSNTELVGYIRAFAIVLAAVICCIYASNDFYISRIAEFTSRQGSELLQSWEREHRSGKRYRAQKALRTTAVLAVFPGWTTLQLVPLVKQHLGSLGLVAIFAWLATIGASIVFLSADAGRASSLPTIEPAASNGES